MEASALFYLDSSDLMLAASLPSLQTRCGTLPHVASAYALWVGQFVPTPSSASVPTVTSYPTHSTLLTTEQQAGAHCENSLPDT